MLTEPVIQFHVDPIFQRELRALPWHVPIAEWGGHGVHLLNIKRGISRHTVIFVRAGRFSFGIKEISEGISRKEIDHYEQLLLRGIHTLVPAGYVVREEEPIPVQTPVGIQYERNDVSHTVTVLVDKVLPDSFLYSRNFRPENRRRIWDAIVRLFVQLHANGIYWGDASLANTLIKFEKRMVPLVGLRTELIAYLADAETLEIHPQLSDTMREADVNFFFESMDWINEDLRTSGVVRNDVHSEEDKTYIRERYAALFDAERKKIAFERQTAFSIDKFLGNIPDPSYVDQFLKHIEEHKWYLSERAGHEFGIAEATKDWYETIFVPICALFRDEHIPELFTGKTAAELYIEIMNNKYYLSEQAGRDVGMAAAMRDYAQRYGATEHHEPLLQMLTDKMLRILGLKEPLLS
ncbi:MAG: DUF4032 domain-containing protein [Bacteroidetes bacterium]|nr:DUF4032 domain-containing protein [Bacteroidota bacterium]